MLRALGHVAAVVHSEFEGAVSARAGEVSLDCCHSKEEGRSPEIEANSGSRMITCRSGSVVASRDKKSSNKGQRPRCEVGGELEKCCTRKMSSLR